MAAADNKGTPVHVETLGSISKTCATDEVGVCFGNDREESESFIDAIEGDLL